MPVYYFAIVDVDGLHVDDTRVECDDIDAAIAMARRAISELAMMPSAIRASPSWRSAFVTIWKIPWCYEYA